MSSGIIDFKIESFPYFTRSAIPKNCRGYYLTFKWSISLVTSQMVVKVSSEFGESGTRIDPKTAELRLISASEIHRRNRILFVFTLPEDRHNPPTLAVVHQLNAVDAALKGFRVVFRMAGFISAKDMRDVAEPLYLPRRLALEKSFLLKKRAGALNVVVYGKHP